MLPTEQRLRADFQRDGYVVVRGALDGYDFSALRRLIKRKVDGQAQRLAEVRVYIGFGHIPSRGHIPIHCRFVLEAAYTVQPFIQIQ